MSTMTEQIIEQIYEAAFVPELWPGVLDQLCGASNCGSGALTVFSEGSAPRFVATDLVRGAIESFTAQNGWQRSEAVPYVLKMPPATFVYEADYYPADLLERDVLRKGVLTPLGLGGQIGSLVTIPTGEMSLFTFERWLHNERPSERDLAALNWHRPHLARASVIAARMGLRFAETMVLAMQSIGLPAAVLNGAGRVIKANEMLTDMPDDFIPLAHGGLAIADSAANRLFQEAIRPSVRNDPATVRSIAVPANDKRLPLVVHTLPLRRSAHELFLGGDLLVAVTAVSTSASTPSPGILSGLFDLSPAEARLAAALAHGKSLAAVAAEQNIQTSTARSYLDQVFRKTGTHKQGELVALLKSVQPLRTPSA
ncbi:MAG TPA: helix-turn-helix transcriptional regulator [Xanthobacteraceae bacterium]